MNIRRIFLIDGGLLGIAGHPAECAVAIQQAGEQAGIRVVVVGRAAATPELRTMFPEFRAVLQAGTFPISTTGVRSIASGLAQIAVSEKTGPGDLFLLPSCHVNEILGVARIIRSRYQRVVSPIVMQFHQLMPPAGDFRVAASRTYQSRWLNRLRTAFRALPEKGGNPTLWTTACDPLNLKYRDLAARKVGILPFPLYKVPASSRTSTRLAAAHVRLAFLGDGRAEKGLVPLLEAIPLTRCAEFSIQCLAPRGYADELLAARAEHLARRSGDARVSIHYDALTPQRFHDAILDCDGVVCPYDPDQYASRASMVFVQAVLHGKPVVVTAGTWMAAEMLAGRAAGVICPWGRDTDTKRMSLLADSVNLLVNRIHEFTEAASQCVSGYAALHNSASYLTQICSR